MKLLEILGLSPAEPDALSLIKRDHDTFRSSLKKLNNTTVKGSKTRTRLFGALRALLIAHEAMEERVIYRTLRRFPEAKDIIMEGLQEHHASDLLREELAALSVTSPDWGPKCHVMGEGLQHHLKEEEQTMFTQARALLSERQLQNLGARMQRLRTSILDKPPRPASSRRVAKRGASSAAKQRTKQRTKKRTKVRSSRR